MSDESYWSRLNSRRIGRRQALAAAGGGAGLAALTAAGCSTQGRTGGASSGTTTQQSGGVPVNGGTFTASLQANPQSLDPQRVSATAQVSISAVMSRVFRFKTGTDPNVSYDHTVEPDLGLSAESPDAINWTIKLRPDAKFQNIAPVNGHAVEAEDVKATFVRSQDPKNPNAGNLAMIDTANIQTPDKTTVVFKLKQPFAPFRKLLASPTYSWIFPREALAGTYDPVKVPIGSGPYTLDSAQPDVAYTYKKWNDYWDKSLGQYVDTIKLAVVPELQTQIAQFSTGNLDELILPTADDLATAQQRNPKAQLLKVETGSPNPLYLQLGNTDSIFQDIRVRRAFSMLINREAIGTVVYGKDQWEALVFVTSYMGRQSLKQKDLPAETAQWFKYDPANGKKLLDAAGQSNLDLKFVYLIGSPTPGSFGSPIWNKLCDAVADQLRQAGIKITAVQQDYAKDYVDSGKGSRQGYFPNDMLVFAGAAPATDADEQLFNHFDSRSTSNAERLKDPKFDAMIDHERTLVSEDERLKALLDIQTYLADQMYVVPTVTTQQSRMYQSRVQNFQYADSGDLSKGTESYAKVWIKA
jgi:peptide/nickel transport system substrate-binding protein